MAKSKGRGQYRDRHDRGIRRPLLSKLFVHGQTRVQGFEQNVNSIFEYLQAIWPQELEDLTWQVRDAPGLSSEADQVRRWSVDRGRKSISIYRLPIERLGSHSRPTPLEARMRVEEQVFEAVADLLGMDPWELVPESFRR